MSSAGSPSVNLWVKPEPFTYGALPVPLHARLTYHNIKKIVSYAKTKGKAGFPRLSFSVWKHIACNKLQLPESLAWMYFSTYSSVSDCLTVQERIEWDKTFAACASQKDVDQVRPQFSAPTFEFVLFLYAQHLHKISLRTSLLNSEEWPSRARSPDLESGRTASSGTKSLDEHGHMTFVLNNLNELLELLVEPDSYHGAGDSNDLSLSLEAIQGLGFLIGASVDRNKLVRPLQEVAIQQQVQQSSGFSKISRSFSFRSLETWLRSHIGQNPFGISSCISSGRRLSWPLAGDEKEPKDNIKRGRIATNALLVPKDSYRGNKIIILSQVCKQTVARSSSTLEGSSVKIHRCNYSFLYLLSPLRSVSVEKCRHSTIVLGPVESTIHINGCEQVTVIAATRRISISGSTMCTLHVLTPTEPLIMAGNDNLMLAPYHTHYGRLDDHMAAVGLGLQPNLWDKPLCLGPEQQEGSAVHTENVWQLMNPKDFYIFTCPFNSEGPTKSVPGGIPSRYQRALLQRDRNIENWQQMVKSSGLSKQQCKTFQNIVEQRFQEWLVETGNKRQLDGLVVSAGGKSKP